jgi:hypothetical protein
MRSGEQLRAQSTKIPREAPKPITPVPMAVGMRIDGSDVIPPHGTRRRSGWRGESVARKWEHERARSWGPIFVGEVGYGAAATDSEA